MNGETHAAVVLLRKLLFGEEPQGPKTLVECIQLRRVLDAGLCGSSSAAKKEPGGWRRSESHTKDWKSKRLNCLETPRHQRHKKCEFFGFNALRS